MEYNSKNKSEILVHVVGFIIRINYFFLFNSNMAVNLFFVELTNTYIGLTFHDSCSFAVTAFRLGFCKVQSLKKRNEQIREYDIIFG